jgi:hypothetical protein
VTGGAPTPGATSERVETPAGAFTFTVIPDTSPSTWLRWRRGLELLAKMAEERRERERARQAQASESRGR